MENPLAACATAYACEASIGHRPQAHNYKSKPFGTHRIIMIILRELWAAPEAGGAAPAALTCSALKRAYTSAMQATAAAQAAGWVCSAGLWNTRCRPQNFW